MRKYSIIIPVYNRPEEIKELLESLQSQSYTNFEVIIVEDGSSVTCEKVVEDFSSKLDISYYYKENSGQGFSRNYGYERAKGDYFVVFDSDCLIPADYLEIVEKHLDRQCLDAFGGPDSDHPDFTNIQKAISYSMTSLFTTGGIRGGKKRLGAFHPRSFNMGISRPVFEETKGYILPRMGEDIEFSIRIIEKGFKTGLIPDAVVYHKRRTNFSQFFRQLHFFGRARINISRYYPRELKLVHTFPAMFTIGIVVAIVMSLVNWQSFQWLAWLYAAYLLIIFLDATIKKGLIVGLLSVPAALMQLTAYGIGFLTEGLRKITKG